MNKINLNSIKRQKVLDDSTSNELKHYTDTLDRFGEIIFDQTEKPSLGKINYNNCGFSKDEGEI